MRNTASALAAGVVCNSQPVKSRPLNRSAAPDVCADKVNKTAHHIRFII
jgi:hypothetical protein